MPIGGFANRVARVDLSSGSVSVRAHSRRIGPASTSAHAAWAFGTSSKTGPTVDPLGPDNLLCFMNGPLTGTEANMSGRMAVVTKSPLTGTVTDSHQGGWSAARLRWAGFDGLMFTGAARSRPTPTSRTAPSSFATPPTSGARAPMTRSSTSRASMARTT